jgi:hypothetical protein
LEFGDPDFLRYHRQIQEIEALMSESPFGIEELIQYTSGMKKLCDQERAKAEAEQKQLAQTKDKLKEFAALLKLYL